MLRKQGAIADGPSIIPFIVSMMDRIWIFLSGRGFEVKGFFEDIFRVCGFAARGEEVFGERVCLSGLTVIRIPWRRKREKGIKEE